MRSELKRSLGPALLCSLTLLCAMSTKVSAQTLLTHHLRKEVASGEASFVHLLPVNQTLRLDIALPLRNRDELEDLAQQIYDPQSPLFHQYLSVAEFTERFGPTEEDYAAVMRFAERNGLTVTSTSRNRVLLSVRGSVRNIERAFQVTMASYRHPRESRIFYAPDREPSPAGLAVPLWHVAGLDNFSIPRPASLRRNTEVSSDALTGSAPGGNFWGSDIRAAYYGGVQLTGASQVVGLLEFGGYNMSDVQAYFTKAGQPLNVPVKAVSTDGSPVTCTGTCDDSEQALDIEQAISMAPGLIQVRVYVARASDLSVFNQMATENYAKSLSCSWGWSPPDPTVDDPIFLEFAVQGQTLFVSSGDKGAYGSGALGTLNLYPAFDWYVTAVGGTVLTTHGPGGAWKSETAWSESGGGIAPDITLPKYQKLTGVITQANQGSLTMRNCPDVAMEANTDNYICYNGICTGGWGGTSFAAPRWAAFLALLNEQRTVNGKQPIGFINNRIYAIGTGSGYSSFFHDITSGTNGKFSAETGYDLVTGWGSPNSAGVFETSLSK